MKYPEVKIMLKKQSSKAKSSKIQNFSGIGMGRVQSPWTRPVPAGCVLKKYWILEFLTLLESFLNFFFAFWVFS